MKVQLVFFSPPKIAAEKNHQEKPNTFQKGKVLLEGAEDFDTTSTNTKKTQKKNCTSDHAAEQKQNSSNKKNRVIIKYQQTKLTSLN